MHKARHIFRCSTTSVRLCHGQPPYLEASSTLPRRLRHGESINQVRLPEALEHAISECFTPHIRADIKAAKRAVNAGRLESLASKRLTIYDFAALRLDRSYAACYRVCHELTCRLPGFTPTSVLEFGAHLGAGSWACSAIWPEPTSTSILLLFEVK